MKRVRLPRLRCALLGLLPLWARDGGEMRLAGGACGRQHKANDACGALSVVDWKRVEGTVLTKNHDH